MPDEFKDRLVNHAKIVLARSERVTSEEAAKQYLVLPFFQLLGYDPLDPDEIIPESHASFSDKFKNKVDYAICENSKPVIAVECKKTGSLSGAERGELKGYYNAVPTVKLGILTDGLRFELYTDTGNENMMDDNPFVTIDLANVAKERINDNALDALKKLRKGTFDPADVGADARRKIFTTKYTSTLEQVFSSPPEEFVKTMMDLAGIEGRRTNKLIEEHTPIVSDAISMFFDKKILERVGFANRADLVKMQQTPSSQAEAPASSPPESVTSSTDGIITTEAELRIFDYVKGRLSYLVDTDELFKKVHELEYRDYKTIFVVFYKAERKGKIFHYTEGPNGENRFHFPDRDDVLEVSDLYEIDQPLLDSFTVRVKDIDGA